MPLSLRKNRVILPGKPRNCSPAAKSDGNRYFLPRSPDAHLGAIGILGGIFDPVHNGHLALAAGARSYFDLSKVLFIPAGRPPHKPHIGASAGDRLAMLLLAIRNEPAFIVWDGELRRKGISYTFDTLRKLIHDFPGRPLYFIVGSDNVREIMTWRRYRDVLAMVTLCVAHRPGYSIRLPASLNVGRIEKFPSPELDVSSSMIKEKIAKGRSCRHMVPAAVREYIYKRKLYT
jgi:nicotinate-nucleotide adenylyltransferase